MENSNYPKTSAFMFIATKNLNKNSYFQSDKAWKNESGSYSTFFLCFWLLASNTKNQIGAVISFLILSVLF